MTSDLEASLRRTLHQRANDIEDLDTVVLDDIVLAPMSAPESPRRTSARTMGAIAAVVLLIVASAGIVIARDDRASTPVATLPEAKSEDSTARAWPLTNDDPLGPPTDDSPLRAPDTATRAYLAEAADLPGDWPVQDITTQDGRSVASYVLQDVDAEVHLARAESGAWYVTAAKTEFARLTIASTRGSGVDVEFALGPRGYGGMLLRLDAIAADGRTLATTDTKATREADPAVPTPEVVSLTWADAEQVAVVRGTVLSDHDDKVSTPDVVIGLWTAALPESTVFVSLPTGFDPRTTQPIYRTTGKVDAVAAAYLRDRFPDYPSPGVTIEPARTRALFAYVRWDIADVVTDGTVVLRRDDDNWAVVAAITPGVDVSDARLEGGRVAGRVTSKNDNSLFADVLDDQGIPVEGSPRPNGLPGAEYRFGTAGGPGTGVLELDVATTVAAPILRVNLVGGTILAVTEVRLAPR